MESFILEHVCLNYYDRDELATLKDISVRFPEHGVVGITGASGSGKSSLLYAMAGLKNQYIKGKIAYCGKEIQACSSKECADLRRTRFGFVFQKHFLIPYLNTIENVTVSAGTAAAGKAEKLLNELQIGKYKSSRVSSLSGGECQRIAIARALIHEPEVVFADEPTADLDRENANRVMNMFWEYGKEHLVFVVTHDQSLFSYFNLMLVLSDGKIAEVR